MDAEPSLLAEDALMDEPAFRRQYESELPQLLRYAYYRTGNLSDAEDVVAQVFLRAWSSLPRYEQRGIPFNHWLYRIAGNVIKDRGRQRERPVGMEVVTGGSGEQAELELAAVRLDLLRALATLPDLQQQVLVLRYVQDLSLIQVARVMGRSENAIKQLAWRALRNLRERVSKDE